MKPSAPSPVAVIRPLDRLLTVPEAARRLQISERTAARRIATGELRSVYIDGRRLVPVHALSTLEAVPGGVRQLS